MNSKTNGWECPNCNCYQDANGNFHSSVFENKSSNMTNADKIRNMTDEELAEFLEGDYGNFETGKAILWLKQSA